MQWRAHSSIFAILSCESFATVTLHAERELTTGDIEPVDIKRLVGRSWRLGRSTLNALLSIVAVAPMTRPYPVTVHSPHYSALLT